MSFILPSKLRHAEASSSNDRLMVEQRTLRLQLEQSETKSMELLQALRTAEGMTK